MSNDHAPIVPPNAPNAKLNSGLTKPPVAAAIPPFKIKFGVHLITKLCRFHNNYLEICTYLLRVPQVRHFGHQRCDRPTHFRNIVAAGDQSGR